MITVEGVSFLDVQDFALMPIYLFFIYLFALLIRNLTLRNSPLKQYYIWGMTAKILGGLAIGYVYGFYYKGGDTFNYYYDSKTFNDALKEGVGYFFKLLALPANKVTIETYESTRWLTFFRDPSGWMSDKIYGIISIFTFHSYPVMSIVISVLSFSGVWALFKTFADQYRFMHREFAIAILFIPSVFFWGSGILKDSISIGCLGWITYCSYQIFFKRRNIGRNLIILFATGYIVLQVKAYIVISFLPALLFWIFFTYRSKIPNQFARMVSGPLVFSITLVFGFLLVRRIGQEFQQFALQNVLATAQNFHEWHSYLAQNANASGYSLGAVDGSWQSVILKFPLAVNVTLFRPYLWEAHSPIMLLSAIESTFILLFTIYIIWKNGFKTIFITISQNPTIFFCFFFSILFAFAVGFTSYNFGALVRYKIPCLPFYLIGLIVLNAQTIQKRAEMARKKQIRARQFVTEEVSA